jgi:hypothetical protein
MSDKCLKHRPDDHKDPRHLNYQYKQYQRKKHHYDRTVCILPEDEPSKDRANLEALEDHALMTPSTSCDILSNTPPEAMPLDTTAREDTMREDAPLATSHDTSLSPPRLDDAMPGGSN